MNNSNNSLPPFAHIANFNWVHSPESNRQMRATLNHETSTPRAQRTLSPLTSCLQQNSFESNGSPLVEDNNSFSSPPDFVRNPDFCDMPTIEFDPSDDFSFSPTILFEDDNELPDNSPALSEIQQPPVTDKGRERQSRGWSFTMFPGVEFQLPLPNLDGFIDDNRIRFIVIGKETCPTTKKVHIQGYLYSRSPVGFTTIKNRLKKFGKHYGLHAPPAHIEMAQGNARSNVVYCSKDGEYQLAG